MNKKTILVIGAHPDDIEFGCGGILLKEKDAGSRIHLLVCSKGESGTNGSPEERQDESKAAAAKLGASLRFIDCGGDGSIRATRHNAVLIARVIREVKPEILLAPSLVQNQHPDHYAVGQAAREAARLSRYGGLEMLKQYPPHAIESFFWYAITPQAEPDEGTQLIFDVGRYLTEWEVLMACHQTQMKTRRYLELQVARAKKLGLESGVDYAQSLWSNDPLLIESLSKAPRGVRQF